MGPNITGIEEYEDKWRMRWHGQGWKNTPNSHHERIGLYMYSVYIWQNLMLSCSRAKTGAPCNTCLVYCFAAVWRSLLSAFYPLSITHCPYPLAVPFVDNLCLWRSLLSACNQSDIGIYWRRRIYCGYIGIYCGYIGIYVLRVLVIQSIRHCQRCFGLRPAADHLNTMSKQKLKTKTKLN